MTHSNDLFAYTARVNNTTLQSKYFKS